MTTTRTIMGRIAKPMIQVLWKSRLPRIIHSKYPTILLYHGVTALAGRYAMDMETFKTHLDFLQSTTELVGPEEATIARSVKGRPRVILTFDDGFGNNFREAIPELKARQIPATFFISSGHSKVQRYLWFASLRAVDEHWPEKDVYIDDRRLTMSGAEREISFRHIWRSVRTAAPHPQGGLDVIDASFGALSEFVDQRTLEACYSGVTQQELSAVSSDPLFQFGGHTVDHVDLTLCNDEQVEFQIVRNRQWIEDALGKRIDLFAYPFGAYNGRVAEIVRSIGFANVHVVDFRTSARGDHFLSRVGIYASSTSVLGVKAYTGNWLRAFDVKVG